jgi:hypothetical protein
MAFRHSDTANFSAFIDGVKTKIRRNGSFKNGRGSSGERTNKQIHRSTPVATRVRSGASVCFWPVATNRGAAIIWPLLAALWTPQ